MQKRPLILVYKIWKNKRWRIRITNFGVVTFLDKRFTTRGKAIAFARTLHSDAKITTSGF